MFIHALIASAALVAAVPTVGTVSAAESREDSSLVSRAGERLRADLTGSGRASGSADYREIVRADGSVVRRFSVEVEDAAPNRLLEILVSGVSIGTVRTNGVGFADFNIRSVTDDVGQQGTVPDMDPSDRVTVRGASITGLLR